ncbi:MAG: flippase-like protein [Gemmatimonadetes bacterium]|nr:flippase-like protein [Gemmatimonadota bacterium]
MTSARIRQAAIGAGIIFVGALLVFAAQRIDHARLLLALHTVRLPWLLAALLCYGAVLPLWALQWHIIAPAGERNSFSRMLGVIAMTSTLYHTSIALVAEASSVVLLALRIGISRSAALSVLAMDQLLVGIAKLALLFMAALMVALPLWMSNGVVALVLAVSALLTICLAGAWQYEWLLARLDRILPHRISAALHAMGVALAPLRSPYRGGSALGIALVKKLVEIAAIVCVQRSFGVAVPIAEAVLVLAAINIFTMIPVVPANLGVYEGAIVLTYRHFGMAPELALGMAIMQHACFFVALGLPGFAWFASTGISRRTATAS